MNTIPFLDKPSLVLIWKKRCYCWECLYRLLIPLKDGDIRGKLLRFDMGGTTVTPNNSEWCPIIAGKMVTPFRDGCHIIWDSERLSLPGFVVWGKTIVRIEDTH